MSEPSPTILVLDRDLFFQAKIGPILARAGYQARFVGTIAALTQALAGGITAALVNCAPNGVDWREAIRVARASGVPVVAFAPHVDTATHVEARALGATVVIANSKLTPTELPVILTRARARDTRLPQDAKETE
jgi:CheY-like chemotaxis protein